MKRILAMILLAAMLLTGCGGVSDTVREQAMSMLPATEPTAKTTEPVTTQSPPELTEIPAAQPMEVPTEPETTEPETTQPPTEAPTETEPTEPLPKPEDSDFVRVKDYIPDIIVELRYATDNNFTGQVIYDFDEAWMRYGSVKKLMLVQEELRQQGLGLKIWDAFRPTQSQFVLWEVCPISKYVANPNVGFSSHSRGNTVDLTLVDSQGVELTMPTGYDDFSDLANRDYGDCDPAAADNARLLEEIMKKHGFTPYYSEWWHYSDSDSYGVDETFYPTKVTTG